MANADQIMHALVSKVEQRFAIDSGSLKTDSRLVDMGIDSLLLVDLILDLKQELDFQLEDLNFSINPTLGEVVDLIAASMPPQLQAGG